jgi:FAD dependent oxidoreductase TIGR03364
MKKYDFIVVGGGVLGTFHAYHAALMGYKVALLERSPSPVGSSVQNFGQVVPSGMNLKWQQYGRKSLEIYQRIQQEFDISLRQNGTVYLASDEAEMTLLEELAAINQANDYPSELLSAAQCLARYEGLKSSYCRGGLFFPEEITLEPRVAISRIQHYLVEKKLLDYYPNSLVSSIEPTRDECVLSTSDGRVYGAQQVLVCSGYEFQILYPQIYAQSDLVLVKLQMLQTAPQPTQRIAGSILTGLSIRRYESFSECPSYQAMKAQEDPDSLAKRWGVHILFKQAVDGSIIIGDTHEYAEINAGQHHDFRQKAALNQFMMEEALKIFDLQDARIQESWIGTYTQCKHSDIYKHSIENRIHLLTGIGGKGMTASAGYAAENILTLL